MLLPSSGRRELDNGKEYQRHWSLTAGRSTSEGHILKQISLHKITKFVLSWARSIWSTLKAMWILSSHLSGIRKFRFGSKFDYQRSVGSVQCVQAAVRLSVQMQGTIKVCLIISHIHFCIVMQCYVYLRVLVVRFNVLLTAHRNYVYQYNRTNKMDYLLSVNFD
jgi:hypothetical protein